VWGASEKQIEGPNGPSPDERGPTRGSPDERPNGLSKKKTKKKIKEGPCGPSLKQGAVRVVEEKKKANGLFFLFLPKRLLPLVLFFLSLRIFIEKLEKP
jgi:hypothetical protein